MIDNLKIVEKIYNINNVIIDNSKIVENFYILMKKKMNENEIFH